MGDSQDSAVSNDFIFLILSSAVELFVGDDFQTISP